MIAPDAARRTIRCVCFERTTQTSTTAKPGGGKFWATYEVPGHIVGSRTRNSMAGGATSEYSQSLVTWGRADAALLAELEDE